MNLATFLLIDGMDGLHDEAVVISDDSDLEESLTQAAARFGPVHIVSPRAIRLGALTKSAASWSPLLEADLFAA